MKYFLLIATFFITVATFAQNGVIKGSVSDLESNNEPLMFAKVSIMETGAETMTDEYGKFQFESLPEGTYTLVYSFVGYSKKEVELNVKSKETTSIKTGLKASTISLEELMLTLASNESEATPFTANN